MATFYKDSKNKLVRDQNRFRKNYRYIRKKPRPLFCDDSTILSNFEWGCYFAEFKDQNQIVHEFPCAFPSAPAVIATTVTKSGNFENFNLFVSAIQASYIIKP